MTSREQQGCVEMMVLQAGPRLTDQYVWGLHTCFMACLIPISASARATSRLLTVKTAYLFIYLTSTWQLLHASVLNTLQPYEEDTTVNPVLQMRKPRQRKLSYLFKVTQLEVTEL